jgi:hypothetical protein
VSTVTERIAIDDAVVNDLRQSFWGEVVSPADAGYEEHRKIWNGSIDRRPGLSAHRPCCVGLCPAGLAPVTASCVESSEPARTTYR